MSISYLRRKACFQNFIQQPVKICYHKENLYTSFSLKERLILAPWLRFHGNLRHRNCSPPQSHSLLCAGSGSPSDPLSHFNKLSQQKNIHFFQLGYFFLFVHWNDNVKHSRGQERAVGTRRKARTTTCCSQVRSAREPAACVLESYHLR